MKDEINSREIKVRWGQNKLKAETENHKVNRVGFPFQGRRHCDPLFFY